jgi:hypothetical protein
VTTRELLHSSPFFTLRGNGTSGDHVDVMGNINMARDILEIVTGNDQDLHGIDRWVSNIRDIAARVKLR